LRIRDPRGVHRAPARAPGRVLDYSSRQNLQCPGPDRFEQQALEI
jgi:hypothetical protein